MNTNQQSQQSRKLNPMKMAIGALVILVVCVGLGVAASFIIQARNTPDEATIAAAPPPDDSGATVAMIGTTGVPLYPGAQPDTGNITQPPPGGLGFIIAGATPGEVKAWYQAVLPEAGLALGPEVAPTAGVDQSLVAVAGDGSQVRLDVWDAGDGQVALVIAPFTGSQPRSAEVTAEGQPPAAPEGQPASGEQPTPMVTAPTPPTVVEPANSPPIEASEAPTTTVVVASVEPATVYAGTLTRLEYTVTVSGQGAVALAATLPEGVMVQVSTLPPEIAYDPTERTLSWGTTLTPGVPNEVRFSAITGLLTEPGEMLLKVVAESPGQEPVIQVARVKLTEYQAGGGATSLVGP